MLTWNTGTRLVDSFLMLLRPTSELFQNSNLFSRNSSIFFRSYIQKQITTHAEAIDKSTQQHERSFIIGISMLIAPRIVHGHAKFPIFIGRANHRNSLLGCGIIAISLDTGAYYNIRISGTQ